METLEEIKEADITVFIEGCEGLMAVTVSNITIFILGAVVMALIFAMGILCFYCLKRRAVRGRKDSELVNCRKTKKTGGPVELVELDPIYDVIENAAVAVSVLENMVDPEPEEPKYVNSVLDPDYVQYEP